MSVPLRESETLKNLMRSFAGESQRFRGAAAPLQEMKHGVDRVVLREVLVWRTRLDVLELPVPVPVGERPLSKPLEAAVGRMAPLGFSRGVG